MRKHVAAIAAATLTIGGMTVGSVSAAQAGEINNAIVNINTQGEAKVGDILTLNAAWQVLLITHSQVILSPLPCPRNSFL